jgi:hypothetical protein
MLLREGQNASECRTGVLTEAGTNFWTYLSQFRLLALAPDEC